MRHIAIILTSVLLFQSFISQAQTPAKVAIPNIDLGIKLGANLAKLSGDNWDNGYKASFLAGAFVGIRMRKVGVQVEAFFSQSTYSVNGTGFYDAYSQFYNNAADSAKHGMFRVNYLNIPVLLQYKIIPLLWLQAGLQYSGVVSVTDADNLVKDAKGLFKSGTTAGVFGLELKLPIHLNAGARYIIGFSSMNNTNISGAWQQKTLQVHLGYTFL